MQLVLSVAQQAVVIEPVVPLQLPVAQAQDLPMVVLLQARAVQQAPRAQAVSHPLQAVVRQQEPVALLMYPVVRVQRQELVVLLQRSAELVLLLEPVVRLVLPVVLAVMMQ